VQAREERGLTYEYSRLKIPTMSRPADLKVTASPTAPPAAPPSGAARVIVLCGGFLAPRSSSFDDTYFGGGLELPSELRDGSFRVVVVHPSPVGSLHDRACQIFREIKTGGAVDFANGQPAGTPYRNDHEMHASSSSDSKPTTPSTPPLHHDWSAESPVHMIGHSYGGNTIRKLLELLTVGHPALCDENGRWPRPSSAWVRSITCINTPLNGAPLVYGLGESPVAPPKVRFGSGGFMLSSIIAAVESLKDRMGDRQRLRLRRWGMDFGLEHLFVRRRSVPEIVWLLCRLSLPWPFGAYDKSALPDGFGHSQRCENAAYDLSVHAATAMNERMEELASEHPGLIEDVFYFSVVGTRRWLGDGTSGASSGGEGARADSRRTIASQLVVAAKHVCYSYFDWVEPKGDAPGAKVPGDDARGDHRRSDDGRDGAYYPQRRHLDGHRATGGGGHDGHDGVCPVRSQAFPWSPRQALEAVYLGGPTAEGGVSVEDVEGVEGEGDGARSRVASTDDDQASSPSHPVSPSFAAALEPPHGGEVGPTSLDYEGDGQAQQAHQPQHVVRPGLFHYELIDADHLGVVVAPSSGEAQRRLFHALYRRLAAISRPRGGGGAERGPDVLISRLPWPSSGSSSASSPCSPGPSSSYCSSYSSPSAEHGAARRSAATAALARARTSVRSATTSRVRLLRRVARSVVSLVSLVVCMVACAVVRAIRPYFRMSEMALSWALVVYGRVVGTKGSGTLTSDRRVCNRHEPTMVVG